MEQNLFSYLQTTVYKIPHEIFMKLGMQIFMSHKDLSLPNLYVIFIPTLRTY